MFNFNLLDNVVDKVTGYTGVVTGRAEYSYDSPNQYLVESIDTTGRPMEAWIAEDRLVLACV